LHRPQPPTKDKEDVLDAYIIEEIKRQEEERRRRDEGRPRLHIEIPRNVPPPRERGEGEEHEPDDDEDHDEHEDDGVIRIDL